MLAPTGSKKDKTSVFELAKNNGYKLVTAQDEFNNLSKQDGKVFAIALNLQQKPRCRMILTAVPARLPWLILLKRY